jgi:hypothetical protein
MAPPPRLLHVANGTSVTDTLESAGISGLTSIWADPLHEGPVPDGLDDDALLDLRAQHHAGSPAAADPRNDMRRWRKTITDHEAYDELVLWFEHDLFDQVNLIQLLVFVRTHVPASTPVSLICIDSFPGRETFHGLGELRASELASLLPARQHVTAAHYDLAERTWLAFRRPTPTALDELIHGDTSALPFLARALRRFLEEYPWTRDGLSRTERQLMTLASEGRADRPAVFHRMSEDEDAYYITDTSYAELVHALATTAPPLLTNGIEGPALTQKGREVLEGRIDRVALCGFDRWFGGVHLHGHAVPWRWDGGRGRIVSS